MKRKNYFKMKLTKVKYYHTSLKHHKPGDILEGRHHDNWNPGLWVFLVDTPLPHFTIHSNAVEENWFVYEVKPDGNVKLGHEEDIIAKMAEIVRCVGGARGNQIIITNVLKGLWEKKMSVMVVRCYAPVLRNEHPMREFVIYGIGEN
jgi:hypothetical protein